jgi:integrase
MANDIFHSLLADEIKGFIDYKQKSGSKYVTSIWALKAFDRFCIASDDQRMTPPLLAEAWMKPGDDKPKYDAGCSVRQLGQYLTEIGHPKAYTICTARGNAPKLLGIEKSGPFANEIKDFINYKRAFGRKYINGEYSLKSFDIFCTIALKKDCNLTCQQLADEWCRKASEKDNADISTVREMGLYLTMHASKKAFMIPYANGDMPRPPFMGYTSLFAEEIKSFLESKRAAGLKYRLEMFRLRDFDRYCNEQNNMSPQQLAESFIQSRKQVGYFMGKRSHSVINEFGKYLTSNAHPTAFLIINKECVIGPFAQDIAAFVAYKKSCGFKYVSEGNYLRRYDAFCALRENISLNSQQIADKWVLKRGDEHPNTRAARIGPVRVFGKYLTSIGHPMAFTIADDTASGIAPKPPYLFSGDDIEIFFAACVEMKPDTKKPYDHIVLPAAFLFMYCMGVRTSELKILIENVNFDTGEILISDSKTGDRAVHMSKELSKLLAQYSSVIDRNFPDRKYLFPASTDRSRNDFAERFKKIWASSVADAGHGSPRLYDFRHHFLYQNIELCMRNGDNVNVLQPYVMRHMGHRQPESFQYYFHLSPPISKEISQIKNNLDWMMPDVPEVPYGY